jgi:hypothetical protein
LPAPTTQVSLAPEHGGMMAQDALQDRSVMLPRGSGEHLPVVASQRKVRTIA